MNDRVVIEPRRAPGEPLLEGAAILCPVPADLQLVLDIWDETWGPTQGKAEQLPLKSLFSIHRLGREGPVLAGPAVGAPQAVMAAEKLFALGLSHLLFLGWAGSLKPEVRTGDLVLVDGAVSEEGTSAHYPLPAGRTAGPDPGLISVLEERLAADGLKRHRGPVWTTDAVFRETVDKVERYGRRGILAVEMEMSALFTLAAFRSKAAAGLMVVTDELAGGKWRPGFDSPRVESARRAAAELILKTAKKVI
jgi:uridine phosphorylase